jgi:hypothetical protein
MSVANHGTDKRCSMATKKAAKKSKKKATKKSPAKANKALSETLGRLTNQHAHMLSADGTDVIRARGEPYPLRGKGKGATRWFRQVEVVETRGERHAYTALVLEVARPADAGKRLRLLAAVKAKDSRAKDRDEGQAALRRVSIPRQ